MVYSISLKKLFHLSVCNKRSLSPAHIFQREGKDLSPPMQRAGLMRLNELPMTLVLSSENHVALKNCAHYEGKLGGAGLWVSACTAGQ